MGVFLASAHTEDDGVWELYMLGSDAVESAKP